MTKKDGVEIPVIPRDVADAITFMKGAANAETIVRMVTDPEYRGPVTLRLRSIPFSTLLSALVNGYEIETTPEEAAEKERQGHVATEYRKRRALAKMTEFQGADVSAIHDGFADGIRFAARTLNINIPEVTQ